MGSVRQIYVSSTRRDLITERAVALAQIDLMGHRAVSSIPEELKKAPGPRRILDECLADLDDCSVYIGIFGWCYGSRPAAREQSYTELEFDRAMQLVAAGRMDAFLFVAADEPRWSACGGSVAADPDDRKRVAALRAKVLGSGRSAMPFEPAGGEPGRTLAALLPARLRTYLAPADRERLAVLPYLCDRAPQVDRAQVLVEGRRRDFSRPLVLLVGGGVEHLPSDFLMSLREHRLARVLLERDPPRRRIQLPWPAAQDEAGFKAELRRSLARELAVGDEDLAVVLGRIDGLVIIDTIVAPGRSPVVREELLAAFVSFWTSMPLPARRRPVVAIACSERPEKTGFFDRLRGAGNRMDTELQRVMGAAASQAADHAAALPLLHPVRKADVESWKQSAEILALGGGAAPGDDIDRLFAGSSERAMRDVAVVLHQYIERRSGGRGADP